MKRFLIITTIFLLPLIVFLVGAEYTLRQIPNDYNYKATWLDEHAQDVECIVLGSSHTHAGVQPKYFPMNTFNAAHSSQPLLYDFEILNKYEQEMSSLQYIILPISYFSLQHAFDDSKEHWKNKYYIIYYKLYNKNFLKNNELFPMNTSMWEKLAKYILFQDNANNAMLGISDSLGWLTNYTLDKRSDKWLESGLTAAKRHTWLTNDSQLLETNIAYIHAIIEIATRHNAKVILLNTPTHEVYRKHLNAEQWQLMNNVCDSIALAHENVYRLNYFSDSTFVDDDFFDADHLNEYGAKRLSIMLSNALDSLGIIH